jgi:hypothetical protein
MIDRVQRKREEKGTIIVLLFKWRRWGDELRKPERRRKKGQVARASLRRQLDFPYWTRFGVRLARYRRLSSAGGGGSCGPNGERRRVGNERVLGQTAVLHRTAVRDRRSRRGKAPSAAARRAGPLDRHTPRRSRRSARDTDGRGTDVRVGNVVWRRDHGPDSLGRRPPGFRERVIS